MEIEAKRFQDPFRCLLKVSPGESEVMMALRPVMMPAALAAAIAAIVASSGLAMAAESLPTGGTLKSLTFKGWCHNAAYRRLGWGDLDVANGKAYLNANGEKLVVMDVADPAQPKEVGVFSFPQAAAFHDIKVRDGYAYTVEYAGNRFRVLDVSNPAHITEKASLPLNGGYQADKLLVFDLTDPAKLVLHSSYKQSHRIFKPHGCKIAGLYLYVQLGWDDSNKSVGRGLTIFEMER